MVEPVEKSTAAVQELVWKNDHESMLLDSRLALFAESARCLAISDIHYGYEVRRRAHGGLWPMWGRGTIESRIDSLLADYSPELLILNGDIIDGTSSGHKQVINWLGELQDRCGQVVLIKGNHDRGALLRSFEFVDRFEMGDFVFHHGHLSGQVVVEDKIEVTGHLHPSFRFNDGAGLSMKFPSLLMAEKRWVMPAFSPWAGGVKIEFADSCTQWVCSPKRVFPVEA